jgi:hypothetical protein
MKVRFFIMARHYDFSRTMYETEVKGFVANLETMAIEQVTATVITAKEFQRYNDKEQGQLIADALHCVPVKYTLGESKEVIYNWNLSDIVGLAHVDTVRK